MKLPAFLKKYFWEVDFDSLNFKKSEFYIIARILEYGDIPAIRWLFRNTNPDMIKESIIKSRGLSKKSANFWSLFFNLDKNKVQCLKKSYQKMQSRHWEY